VVSLDFSKPVTTRKDINNFVKHQHKIEKSLTQLFVGLARDPRWENAPLMGDFKQRYQQRQDSIRIAINRFNDIVAKSPYPINIGEPVSNTSSDSASHK
jgi:hypothetical protein